MSLKRAESLRDQLLRWLLLPLLLVLLISAWFSHRSAVEIADIAFDRLLMGSADAIAEDIEFKNGELVVDLPYAALELLESNINERIFYRVVSPDGQNVTGYEDLPLPPPHARVVIMDDSEALFYRAQYRGDSLHLIGLKKKMYGTGITNPVLVVVAATGDARDALSHQILVHGLVRQLLLIGIAALLVWFGLARGLRPLMRLRDGIAERSAMDLTPIDTSSVPAEVRPLIDALNQHSGRIDRMVTGRTQFIADATHQMRTPIAEMRTQIDYCLRQNDSGLAFSMLRDLRGDVDRLAHLVSQMLMQARADPDGIAMQSQQQIDLGELAQQTALEKVPAARQKFIDLSYEAPEHKAVVSGNALLLHELIVNLLDNAIAYTQVGGYVSVRVRADVAGSPQPCVWLEVEDNGPGIADEELDLVFERFYRSASHVDTVPAGSGLGLSIVRDIAAGHGASVSLNKSLMGSGLLVRLSIPASPEALP